MESKTPMQELISLIEKHPQFGVNNYVDSIYRKAITIRDSSESTLIAEHKMMREALEKLKKERFTASSCRFLASETLKKLGR